MAKNQTRRNFLRSAPLAAAAVTLGGKTAFAASAPTAPEPFVLFPAETIANAVGGPHPKAGNANFYDSKAVPLTIVITTEEKKVGKEFEYHEGRDHIFQILEGACVYELGGTPTNARNTKPGEWLAPESAGAKKVALKKGDMLVVPRGTPHKRTTESSVTFMLISTTGSV